MAQASQDEIKEFHRKIETCELDHELIDFVKHHPEVIEIRTGADNNTSLLLAATAQDARSVMMLIEAGADPDATNRHGENVLQIAVKNKDVRSAEFIFRALAKKHPNNPSAICTPELAKELIILITYTKIPELNKQIFDTGIVNINDPLLPDGSTALHLAAKIDTPVTGFDYPNISRSERTTKFLLREGADPSIHTDSGSTPLLIAAGNEQATSAQFIADALGERYADDEVKLLNALTDPGKGYKTPIDILNENKGSAAKGAANYIDGKIASIIENVPPTKLASYRNLETARAKRASHARTREMQRREALGDHEPGF